MTTALIDKEAEVIALSDNELVRRAYAFVDRFEADDELTDAYYWLLGEIIERWRPSAAWSDHLRWAEQWAGDPEQREGELDAVREAIARRARARLISQMPLTPAPKED